MRKTNAEIAEMVAARGYDFQRVLDDIDVSRMPEDEEKELTEVELVQLVESICLGLDCEDENNI